MVEIQDSVEILKFAEEFCKRILIFKFDLEDKK
jgi:hypothetical protein